MAVRRRPFGLIHVVTYRIHTSGGGPSITLASQPVSVGAEWPVRSVSRANLPPNLSPLPSNYTEKPSLLVSINGHRACVGDRVSLKTPSYQTAAGAGA